MNRKLSLRMLCSSLLLVISCALSAQASSPAGDATSDALRQCTMLKRIFSYAKHLRASEKIVVLVVAADRNDPEATRVALVFREQGLFPAIVSVADLTDDLTATLTPESAVVYVATTKDFELVTAFAAAKGFLSVSARPTLTEAGHVSVSVDIARERPEIVVNLPRLQTEGHELSSELLKLARVIR